MRRNVAVHLVLSIKALTLMDTGVLLRDKLPRLNTRFLSGQVSERVVARIVWLCGLVVDDQVWAGLDEQFAEAAASWGVLSGDKLDAAITVWLHTLDPDAVRRARDQHRDRDFRVGRRDDVTSTTSVFGRVNSIDAAIMVDAYHEFDHPFEMIDGIYEALRPGGRIFFLEYRGEDASVPIRPLHKMTGEQVVKEMSVFGLEWTDTLDFLPWQHMMIFTKIE